MHNHPIGGSCGALEKQTVCLRAKLAHAASIAAGALAPYGTFGQRGVLAARAGEDLLLCSAQNASENSPAEGADVLRALTAAIANMDLSRGDAEVAASRVLTLRLHP